MTYLIVAAVLLTAVMVAVNFNLERKAREADKAETLRLRAMTTAERQEALVQAKGVRALSRLHYQNMSRLYWSFKWGHRHNPHKIRYLVAQAQYSAAQARVTKLEGLIAELDTNAD